MADVNPRVMEMVANELKKSPDLSNAELLKKATRIDPSVAELSARQFNARYPLQVKRALRPRKRTTRKPGKTQARVRGGRVAGGNGDRDRIRGVLLDLARDIANAQGKGDVVDVIAGIEGYVDRVVKAGR